jgi:nucleoside-diphosphate-sugar epimerase
MEFHTSPVSRTVFITGANGAIGRSTAIAFRRQGYTVYGLVRSAEKAQKAFLAQEEIIPVIGDSGDPKTYAHIIEKSGLIIESSTLTATNAYILNVINEAKKAKTETGELKIVIWVTGYLQYPFEEEIFKTEGVNVLSVRPTFIYGLNGGPVWKEIFFAPVKEGEKVPIHGSKDKRWPWCHLIDLAEAFPMLVQNIDKVKSRYVRIGLSEALSPTYEEIVKASARAMGYKGEFEYLPPPDGTLVQFVDREPTCDNSFITSLGWKPKFDTRNLIPNIPLYWESFKAFNE